jgi:hypothetical protein
MRIGIRIIFALMMDETTQASQALLVGNRVAGRGGVKPLDDAILLETHYNDVGLYRM